MTQYLNINIFWFILSMILPVFGLFLLALWVSMFFHLIQNKNVKNRGIWVFILFFTSIIGGVIYYFMVKRKLDKDLNNLELEKLEYNNNPRDKTFQ